MLPALDISKYQGAWVDRGDPIVMIKMSGGDDGLYMDSDAASNYGGAVADGRAVGGYHFAGNTNPVAEATYFLQAMSPLAENDVYALDWELPVGTAGAVEWCQTFMQTIHDKIGVWPLIYMNLNTLNSYDWTPVLANSGLWLADWAVSPDQNIPTLHTYVMQQYSDGPTYDHDEWFGTVDQFKAYGYHAPNASQPTPPVAQPPTPPVSPPEPAPSTPTPPAASTPPATSVTGTTTGSGTTSTTITVGLGGTTSSTTTSKPTLNLTPNAPSKSSTSTLHVSFLQSILKFIKSLLGLK